MYAIGVIMHNLVYWNHSVGCWQVSIGHGTMQSANPNFLRLTDKLTNGWPDAE